MSKFMKSLYKIAWIQLHVRDARYTLGNTIPTVKSTATIARILITHTSPPLYAIFWLNPLS